MRDDHEHAAIPRFPLAWPAGWKRTPLNSRQNAAFRTKQTVDQRVSVMIATGRLERELEALGADDPVLSTNVSLRLDGRPRSDENPRDPGAAVYFRFKGKATVFACDRFHAFADNIAAIAAHVDALRRVERYGVGTIDQALAGYKALPADTAADWRQVFGFAADARVTVDEVNTRHRDRAKTAHPDRGGTDEGMAHFNRARDYALQELGE
jgi:hypothetical protein